MKTELEDPVAPILVLGIGNSLLADDGVGLELLERLRPEYAGDARIDFVDGGTQGMMLVGTLEHRRALLLLDAVERGAQPGQVHVVRETQRLACPRGFGAHGGNASELLAAAQLVGVLPQRVDLVGVEPAELRTHVGLSAAVRRALPAALVRARLQLSELLGELCAEGAAECTN